MAKTNAVSALARFLEMLESLTPSSAMRRLSGSNVVVFPGYPSTLKAEVHRRERVAQKGSARQARSLAGTPASGFGSGRLV